MKKFLGGLAICAAVAVMFSSCRVQKGCEAYSKVEVKKPSTRI